MRYSPIFSHFFDQHCLPETMTYSLAITLLFGLLHHCLVLSFLFIFCLDTCHCQASLHSHLAVGISRISFFGSFSMGFSPSPLCPYPPLVLSVSPSSQGMSDVRVLFSRINSDDFLCPHSLPLCVVPPRMRGLCFWG